MLGLWSVAIAISSALAAPAAVALPVPEVVFAATTQASGTTRSGPSYVASSRILFNRSVDTPRGRRTDIFTVRTDGTAELQLTRGPGERYAGGYSPHNSRIAFVSGGAVGSLWVMNADGTSARPLGALSGACPRFSPSGDRIAYRGGDFGEVWVARADGTQARRLSGSAEEFDQCPSWSPDGRQLTFVRYQGFSSSDVWIMPSGGGAARRLTTDGAAKTSAAWSPDGRRIAYDRGGDLWVMAANGTGKRALTTDPAAESDPVWSAGSNKLAYAKATGSTFTVWMLEIGKPPTSLGVTGSPAGWRGQ